MSVTLYIILATFIVATSLSYVTTIAAPSWPIAIVLMLVMLLGTIMTRRQRRVAAIFIGIALSIGAATMLRHDFTRGMTHRGFMQGKVLAQSAHQLRLQADIGKIDLKLQPFSGQLPSWQIGDWLICRVDLRRAERGRIPGGRDPRLQQLAEGVTASGYARHCRLMHQQVNRSPAARFKQQVDKLLNNIDHPEGITILRAMLLGEQQALSPELKEIFRKSGLYHLLVVSGSNLTLLASFLYALVALLLSVHAPLLNRLNRHLWSFIVATFGALFYLAVVGDQAPVVRASVAGAVFLLSLLLQRPFLVLHALALVVLGMLICRPYYLFSVSFQLTVAATFGILFGMQQRGAMLRLALYPNAKALQNVTRRLANIWLCMGWSSLCAFLFTLPIIVYHFHRLSVWSLICNWLYIPWIGWVILPVGFFGLLLTPIFPPLATVAFETAATLCELIVAQLRDLTKLPGMDLHLAAPTLLLISAWYVFIILMNVSAPTERGQYFWRVRWTVSMFLLVHLLVYVGWSWQSRLNVAVLDVGDGLSVVIEVESAWRARQVVIVDTGRPRTCASDLLAYLGYRGIEKIAAVYISHWDADHAGCLDSLLVSKQVGTVFASYVPDKKLAFDAKALTLLRSGDVQHYDQLKVSTVFPRHDEALAASSNNRSLVVDLQYRGRHLLLPGDIEKLVEPAVVAAWDKQAAAVDVLLAPHHGSKTSSSPLFVAAFNPRNVVISRRHQPGKGVVERYRQAGAIIFNTAKSGSILIEMSGAKEVAELGVSGYTCDPEGNPYNGWGPCP